MNDFNTTTAENKPREVWLPMHHCARRLIDNRYLYEISNMGNVRRLMPDDSYKPVPVQTNAEGYQTITVKGGEGTPMKLYLHRCVAVTFIPNPNGFTTVDHVNGDKSDNRTANLRWCSLADNIRFANDRIKPMYPKHPVMLSKDNTELKFRTASRAAHYLGVSIHAIIAGTKGHYRPGGWTVTSLMKKPPVNRQLFDDTEI